MSYIPFAPASDGNLGRVAAALESRSRDPSIAENYDSTSTYEVGKHVRHEGLVYKCITAITTAESWNAAHWREVKIVDELETQNDNIAKLQEGIAIIVNGDTATVAVPVGGYAYLKNNTHGLANGLYKNASSSAFPVSGRTADNTVFTAVPTGAANELNSNIKNMFKPVTGTITLAANQSGYIDVDVPNVSGMTPVYVVACSTNHTDSWITQAYLTSNNTKVRIGLFSSFGQSVTGTVLIIYQ